MLKYELFLSLNLKFFGEAPLSKYPCLKHCLIYLLIILRKVYLFDFVCLILQVGFFNFFLP